MATHQALDEVLVLVTVVNEEVYQFEGSSTCSHVEPSSEGQESVVSTTRIFSSNL